MAVDFFEGFDKYGPPDVTRNTRSPLNLWTLIAGEWGQNGTDSVIDIVVPLSPFGQALKLNPNSKGGLRRSIASSGRVIGGCWFSYITGNTGQTGWCWSKGATACVSITIDVGGHVVLHQQDVNGTAIATSVTSVPPGTPHTIAWDISIGAAANYQIWLDGISVFSGTGNTGNGQTSVDTFYLGTIATGAGGTPTIMTFDNLYHFNASGGTNNAVLIVVPQVDTNYMVSDSAVQFANTQGIIGEAFSEVGSSYFINLNTMALRKFTPAFNCSLQSVNAYCLTSQPTLNAKALLYADSAGAPAALLAVGVTTTGPIQDNVFVMPFGAGQALTAGTPYWIGFMDDNSSTWALSNNSSNTWRKSITYPTAPNPAGAATATGEPSFLVYGVVTGIASNNWASVTANPPWMPIGNDISFLSDSTVGDEDLYNSSALFQTPAVIYSSSCKAMCRNSDNGARTVDMRMKSGATDSAGSAPGQTPITAYTWLSSYFETDPNTAAAWTLANLNSALNGFKIAS